MTSRGHPRTITTDEHLELMADLFDMLSDPTRLRLLMQLREHGELCVGDLAAATGTNESALSHALRLLRAHDIVDARRDGRWIYYSLADEHVRLLLDATAEHFEREHR
jgi:ArsR family transcriptional regulator, lead/cadmium/zinc/bismuth-responsive transcriptional repressor